MMTILRWWLYSHSKAIEKQKKKQKEKEKEKYLKKNQTLVSHFMKRRDYFAKVPCMHMHTFFIPTSPSGPHSYHKKEKWLNTWETPTPTSTT